MVENGVRKEVAYLKNMIADYKSGIDMGRQVISKAEEMALMYQEKKERATKFLEEEEEEIKELEEKMEKAEARLKELMK